MRREKPSIGRKEENKHKSREKLRNSIIFMVIRSISQKLFNTHIVHFLGLSVLTQNLLTEPFYLKKLKISIFFRRFFEPYGSEQYNSCYLRIQGVSRSLVAHKKLKKLNSEKKMEGTSIKYLICLILVNLCLGKNCKMDKSV